MTAGLNQIILGALAIMWVVVLAWEFIGDLRDGRSRRDPMRSFHQQLNVLGTMAPRKLVNPAHRMYTNATPARLVAAGIPQSRTHAAERRRIVFMILAAATGISAMGWMLSSGLATGIALAITGGALIVFAWQAIKRRQASVERAQKVSYLPSATRLDVAPSPVRRRVN
ncbi:MAG: hypothetical protein GY708_01650 [Actinomycetia bacterium]|nr:hypothetical protein [Actinomycetes bacterium]MCP4960948.1 hypothetical protein [Actinomycetes bacterium]